MKNLLLIGSLSTILVSCGASTRAFSGATQTNLVKTVSIEQNCPKENIKILEKARGVGQATYQVEACGKTYVYKQIGSVFMEGSKADEMVNKMSK